MRGFMKTPPGLQPLVDDGVIAAGATTTDDTLAGSSTGTGTYPETRYDGATAFASGFGSVPNGCRQGPGVTQGLPRAVPALHEWAREPLPTADGFRRRGEPRAVRAPG